MSDTVGDGSVGQVMFTGRVAVVTGAGGGVGRAHAVLLAERGANVVINDVPGSAAVQVAQEIVDVGGSAIVCEADLTTEGAPEALVGAAIDEFGRLDIVINNAGLLRAADFGEMTIETFDRVLAVNLRATFAVTLAAWPRLVEQGYGRILCTTSNSGLLGTAGSTAYAAAKAGLWGFVRSLALEARGTGVHVNALAPIAFTTMSMNSRIAPPAWRSGEGDEWSRRLAPDLVAPVAAWLVHEDCDLNGQVWSAAGGRVARFFMGLTDGFADAHLTPEMVRACADEIIHDAHFDELRRAADEGRLLRARLLG